MESSNLEHRFYAKTDCPRHTVCPTPNFCDLKGMCKGSSKGRDKWDFRFLELAKHITSWSKDPSTKCGAVLVRPDRTIASMGYNGFPRGIDDSEDKYLDREQKYARVIHAEMNAILTCPERPKGLTLYAYNQGWGPSCDRCAAHIIQSGITRVVYDLAEVPDRAQGSIALAMHLFREAQIIVDGVRI